MDLRYARQVALPKVGSDGQKRLSNASALVVGAGGLGSPVLTYLAAAGVGRIGVVDEDMVSLSNLNRQFLHTTGDIGRLKVESALQSLTALNGDIRIVPHAEHLEEDNAPDLLEGYDIVLGAVDSFASRAVINRAAAKLNMPYIDGGVSGFSGRILFSHPPHTPCLSCVLPDKSAKKTPDGVLGATAGVIGSMQANLALLWLLDGHNPLQDKMLIYDGWRMSFDLVDIRRNEACPVCGGTI